MAKHSFDNVFDPEVLAKLVPNKDGENGESKTFTVHLTDGSTYIVPITSKQSGLEVGAEDKIKADKKYKDLKIKKDKEKQK